MNLIVAKVYPLRRAFDQGCLRQKWLKRGWPLHDAYAPGPEIQVTLDSTGLRLLFGQVKSGLGQPR